MKTSVIEVHDMLSVLSVDGVEERIGKVPGVESVTVNSAAPAPTAAKPKSAPGVALAGDEKKDKAPGKS